MTSSHHTPPGAYGAAANPTRFEFWSASLVLSVLTTSVYLNSLTGGFVWDDLLIVLKNPMVVGEASLRDLLLTDLWSAVSTSSSFYRPMPILLFRTLHRMFGSNPVAFHAANLFLHTATTILVLWLARRLVEPDPDSRMLPSIFAGALLFALHPVHTQAVAWISGVMDVGATAFSLGAILLADSRARHTIDTRLCLSAAMLLVALLFKEVAVVTLVLIVLLDILQAPRFGLSFLRRSAGHWALLTVPVIIYMAARSVALGGTLVDSSRHSLRFTSLLTETPTFALKYLAQLLAPQPLLAIHDVRAHTSTAAVGVALMVALLVVALMIVAAWKGPRLVTAGVAILLTSLLPSLLVPALAPPDQLHEAYGERYLYFPSVGLALLATAAVNRLDVHSRVLSRWAVGTIGLVFAILTVSSNRAWRSDLTLWQHNLAYTPGLAIAHVNLATALHSAGDVRASDAELDKVVDPSTNDIVPYLVLRAMNAGRLGHHARAAEILSEAASHSPDNPNVLYNLGVALSNDGKDAQAAVVYEKCISLQPAHADANNNVGVIYARAGRISAARDRFAAAVRARRGDPSAAANLAMAEKLLAASPPAGTGNAPTPRR